PTSQTAPSPRAGPPRSSRRPFLVGDAMSLPFAPASFDAVAVAFGLRNVADPAAVLREIHRALRSGGRLAILEFARVPNPVFRALYDLYSFTLLAGLGRLVSGHPDAYWYLPVSVRHWLDQAAMLRLLGETGFVNATCRNLAQGVVAIYRAEAGARCLNSPKSRPWPGTSAGGWAAGRSAACGFSHLPRSGRLGRAALPPPSAAGP